MSEEKIGLIRINIENIAALQELEANYLRPNAVFGVVAIDRKGEIHFGKLEKILHKHEVGSLERDLCMTTHMPADVMLFDDEIASLYVIARVNYSSD